MTKTYTSREQDSECLYYYRARYYNPCIGRFISEDPIGFQSGDANFYRYVMSNPLIYNDPSGEFISIFFSGLGKTSTGAVIGGAIGTVAGAAIGATLGLAGALGGGFIGGQLGSAIGNYIGGGNPIGKDDLPLNDSLNYTPSNHVTLDSILNSNTNNENSCG